MQGVHENQSPYENPESPKEVRNPVRKLGDTYGEVRSGNQRSDRSSGW
jgi:hypothetical protein